LIKFIAVGQATLFDNDLAMSKVKLAADQIYAVNHDSSMYYIDQTREMLPQHPVIPMMEGVLILYENIPVLKEDVFKRFESKMEETTRLATKMGDHPEGVYFELASRGLLAEYYADRGFYIKAVDEASRAYDNLKKGMELTDEYPEFLFAAGIYNYFREAYPDKYPIVKPFMWLFRSGDKALGIQQVTEASRITTLSKVESYMYLAYIYIRYEEEPEKAQEFMIDLASQYPTNLYIQSKYLESLCIEGSYSKMSMELVEKLMYSKRTYFELAGHLFNGLYKEHVLREYNAAFKQYQLAIGLGKKLEGFADHFKSIAYLGSGRILADRNDPNANTK
jgi:tetratricopeptide (TPR) repeat protein